MSAGTNGQRAWWHFWVRPGTDGNQQLRLTQAHERCVMVWLLEMTATDIAEDLKRLEAQFRNRRVVFVHSGHDFSPMVAAHVVFEALPPIASMRANPGLMDWGAWVADRFALLQAAWAPERAIRYGMPPETYLAQARAIAAEVTVHAGAS